MNIYGLIRRFFTEHDRDRTDAKFDHLDARIDDLNITTTRIESSINSLNHVTLANQELFEQKLNNNRAGQENLKEMITMRMSLIEDLIRSKICNS
jgi:uncharacterized coiled-coil protein SlyX